MFIEQNKRRLAEEEEFPELNGEQAFMEREEIDNLLEHGGNMYEHEDYNEDDDVYGDELELDVSTSISSLLFFIVSGKWKCG